MKRDNTRPILRLFTAQQKMKISLVLIAAVLLTACGSTRQVPELIDPIANNESYRPVEKGDVGNTIVKLANVLGEEYCHFFKSATPIREINVDLGQYVNEGDILAYMDNEKLELELAKAQAGLEEQNRLIICNTQMYEDRIKGQEMALESAKRSLQAMETAQSNRDEALKDDPEAFTSYEDTVMLDRNTEKAKKRVEDAETDLNVTKENYRFDIMLSNHKATIIGEDIARIQEKLDERVIKAKHSGYVTYIKNLSEGNVADAFENVVIVSDNDKLHFEIDEKITSTFEEVNLPLMTDMFCYFDGAKREIVKYKYSNAEYMAMESVKNYPFVRFEIDGTLPDYVKAGEVVPLYFTGKGVTDVLVIGTDSLYEEGDRAWVYVKKDEGREKREVTIGLRNMTRVEVVSGLEEGEQVYYSSQAMMPADYSEVTLSKEDFEPITDGVGLKPFRAYTVSHSYRQESEGKVVSVNITSSGNVSEGDLICEIDVAEGLSKLTETENRINEIKERYESSVESANKRIDELTEDMSYERDLTMKQSYQIEIDSIRSEILALTASYEYNLTIANLDHDYYAREMDADGVRRVYAKQSGLISNINMRENKKVAVAGAEEIFRINDETSMKVGIDTGEVFLTVGSKVFFKHSETDESICEGYVVGNSAYNDKAYLATLDDKTYVCHSTGKSKGNIAYVITTGIDRDSDTTKIKASYSVSTLHGVIVVPKMAVYEEPVKGQETILYYVWRKSNGNMVKTYITTQPDINTPSQVCALDGLSDGDVVIVPDKR